MSSYQSIPTADAVASSIEGDEQPLELSPQESSTSSDDNDNTNRSHPRRSGGVVMVTAASATLLLLLAFLSGRSYSSSLGYETNLDDMNNIQKDNVPNRLCEIYHDPTSRSNKDKTATTNVIRLIETSFGEPSQPWQEVPCIHRYNRRFLLDSLLSSSSVPQQRRQQQQQTSSSRPSALINVDFTNIVFQNRQPILGFGGAFTEASALNFWSLNEKGRNATLELLFGKDGLGYRYVLALRLCVSLCRMCKCI